ncbi:MAG: hypothetical protein P1U38_09590 [Aeromicrobium sp.]|uniref:hypothetical protein n=1 Tax=Aeromicrobium sp. TaxID=1871063 RepID=UPI0026318364|nr:hypothetical protein [Aeromicrobium sp.]MDF1705013.1 hypothetical protein [Aeromicrobium sp.]
MSEEVPDLVQPGTLQYIDREKMQAAIRCLGVAPESISSLTLSGDEATFTVTIPVLEMSINQHLVANAEGAS